MHGFVYLWFDCKHSRYYVGSHWGSESDGYVCSSRWMRQAYRRRPEDFRRRILKRVHSRNELVLEEQRWLNMIHPDEVGTRYYNLSLTTFVTWHTSDTSRKTVAQKISQTKTGQKRKPFSEEHRRRLSEANKRRKGTKRKTPLSEKSRQQISASLKKYHASREDNA